MKKYIIAIMVVMVAIGGMFALRGNVEEAILNAGMEQALGTTDIYELTKEEILKQEGVADVTYKVYEGGSCEYRVEYDSGLVIIRFFSNETELTAA